jgi:hypothetical protein
VQDGSVVEGHFLKKKREIRCERSRTFTAVVIEGLVGLQARRAGLNSFTVARNLLAACAHLAPLTLQPSHPLLFPFAPHLQATCDGRRTNGG